MTRPGRLELLLGMLVELPEVRGLIGLQLRPSSAPLKFLPGVPPEAPAARATDHVPTRPRRTVAVRPRVLVPVPSPRKRPLWPRRRPLWRTARLLRIPLANCAVDGAVSVRHARRAERSSLLEPWAENTLHMSMNLATRLEVQTVRQSVRMASQVAASSLAMEAHVQSRDQSSKRAFNAHAARPNGRPNVHATAKHGSNASSCRCHFHRQKSIRSG